MSEGPSLLVFIPRDLNETDIKAQLRQVSCLLGGGGGGWKPSDGVTHNTHRCKAAARFTRPSQLRCVLLIVPAVPLLPCSCNTQGELLRGQGSPLGLTACQHRVPRTGPCSCSCCPRTRLPRPRASASMCPPSSRRVRALVPSVCGPCLTSRHARLRSCAQRRCVGLLRKQVEGHLTCCCSRGRQDGRGAHQRHGQCGARGEELDAAKCVCGR